MAAITIKVTPSEEMKQSLDGLREFVARIDEIMSSPEIKILIALYPELYREAAQATVNDLVEKQKNYDKNDRSA